MSYRATQDLFTQGHYFPKQEMELTNLICRNKYSTGQNEKTEEYVPNERTKIRSTENKQLSLINRSK